MRCSNCRSDNPAGKKFCGDCGAPLANSCPKCGAENPPSKRFCGDCGAALAPQNATHSAVSSSDTPKIAISGERTPATTDGERKTVTALFADIRGSTELMEDLDPEEARAIIDPALNLMIEAVGHYDGYIVQSTGDGIFALFGAPVAHEDHPQRALYAALRLQEATRRYSAKLVADGGTPLETRVGINTGEVVVRTLTTADGHAEYTPIGHTANLASRMEAIAPSGSIAITEHTRRLVEGYFQLKSRGPTRVKGLAEPINVYEVTGLGLLRTRLQRAAALGLTKFVGRQREMDALKHAAEQAQAGRGQIVAVMADPGVGKSRLFYEFNATSQSGWTVLEAFSVSHGKASAYLPVFELLSAYFEISRDDDERKRRERILGKVLGLDRSLEEALPYLYSLYGIAEAGDSLAQMEPQVRRRRTLDAIKRLLMRESLNQPLMLIFEDLHWIDSETQTLLNLLVDAIANARILLLVNYRPEYRHEWSNRTHYTQLRLDPLARESAEEMLLALLGDEQDLAPLKRLIIERTEGTPFFIEEMVQVLFEDGVVQRNGVLKLAKPISTVKVPATVQAVLASRVDRLAPAEKELLQTLAVLGHEFSLTLVQRVTATSGDELEQMLSHLQLSEFINEQPAVGDIEYVFKHALTQEVAYNSVLGERRKVLHERTAAALESLFVERLDDHLGELAHHYRRSSNNQKAVKYLDLAARQAVQRSAYSEAKEHLTVGLELLKRLPETADRDHKELGMQVALARSFAITSGLGAADAGRALLRARELSKAIGEPAELFTMLCGLVSHYTLQLQLAAGYKLGQELLALAKTAKQPVGLEPVHARLGLSLMMLGDLPAARVHFEHVFAGMDRFALEFIESFYESNFYPMWGTWALWALGYSDQAREWSRRALAAAERLSRPTVLATAYGGAAMLHMLLLDERAAVQYADMDIAIAEQVQFSFDLAYARIVRGWALGVRGCLEKGVTEMRESMTSAEAVGYSRRPRWYPYLAQLEAKSKGPEQGLEVITEGLALLEKVEERFNESELYRVKGELLLAQDSSNTDQAQSCFQQAIAVARKQSAKSLELRSTTSLARLLARQGCRNEARGMLAEIYNWFTEGFDTADLKDARALLDELSV
jgi:class 3 adenylate cyclase/tetratricopeptide (TPR) repeat protein